ncbi:restriction endonuclease subunit S [Streptomyces sp. NPDC001165]|uniref:restriction endonuclease subunit S n=1 Tax=Streptomyces sp. NPDC001165 TaxID=3364546 RepID=UPI0036D0F094
MSDWPAVPIDKVVQVIGGGTPKKSEAKYYGGDIPWVTPKDMKTSVISQAQVNITDEAVQQSTTKIAPRGSVLIVVRSGVLKHTVPVAVNQVPVAINQDMKALICGGRIDAGYLARFIKYRSSEILSWVRATTADNFPIDKLKRMEIPLPVLAEQERVAAVLDQVDILRTKRREVIALLDDLAQSIFLDMFGNPDEVTKKVPLSSVANIASGITKGRKEPSGELQDVPYLAVVNVQDRKLNLSTVKEISVSVAELERFRLLSEDLLLTEGGDPDKLGRGTLWREELPVCIHQNHVFRVRVTDREKIDPVYLNWVMSSSYGKSYFLRTAKQTTGIASINKSQLGAFPLPVSPIVQQREFRSRIERVQAHQQAHRIHLAALDELFTSLQHRAFSGTLWDHEAPSDAA